MINKFKIFVRIFVDLFHIFERRDKIIFILFLITSLFNTLIELFSLVFLVNLLYIIADLNQGSSQILTLLNKIIEKNPILISTYLMLITITLKFLFQTIFYFKHEKFGFEIQKKISEKVFLKILNVEYLDYLKFSSSKITRILTNDLVRINNQLISPFITFVNEFLLIISIAVFIFIYDPILGLSILVFSILTMLLFMLSINKKIKNYTSEVIRLNTNLIRHILESYRSYVEINLFNVKSNFYKKFTNISDGLMKNGHRMIFLIKVPKNIFELLIFISLSILIFILNFLERVDLIIEYVGILTLATFKIIPSLNKLSVSLQSIQYFSNPFYDIKRILNFDEFLNNKILHNNNFEILNYNKLNYSYEKNKIISDSNFIIKKNDFIGIIGESGSGKSTLVKLLSGLLKDETIEIYLDRKPINSEYLRNLFSIVQQETMILDQTIYENIALNFNVNKLDKIKINKLLKKVNLFKIFEYKLEESLGENGNKISGGQKQRIGIARALFFNKKIIILDESTSNLDELNQKEVIDTLNKLKNKITIIFISHNVKNLRYCNRIIEIKNRKIIEIKC